MLDILDKLCAGGAQEAHLEELERLARQVAAGSLCGLGKTAPNPVQVLDCRDYLHFARKSNGLRIVYDKEVQRLHDASD